MPARVEPYKPKNHVRIVSAASLFDGHDAAINVMRRILQASGAEVIHLGHNRSVAEIVDCAIQEDAQGIAISSYQGGHIEYFKYMHDLLEERGAGDIKIFGGGGGTILPAEIEELHDYGITRIFSPDDGRELGLQGMINLVMESCDFQTVMPPLDGQVDRLPERDPKAIAELITLAENFPELEEQLQQRLASLPKPDVCPVLGITGTGGSGKSSMVDELVRRFLIDFPEKTVAIVSVDPSRRKSGGALLGDRIRMNAIYNPRVYMRSLATRQSNLALSKYVANSIEICKAAGFDLVIVETSGIGQSDTEIVDHSDVALYVMTAEYGAATQLEKIDMIDFADVIAINKFDKRGSLDALRDVRKQYQRNHMLFESPDDDLPIFGTIASTFNDAGTNRLYRSLMDTLAEKTGAPLATDYAPSRDESDKMLVIPPERVRYLAEIAEASGDYDEFVSAQVGMARQLFQLAGAIDQLRDTTDEDAPPCAVREQAPDDAAEVGTLVERYNALLDRLDVDCKEALRAWPETKRRYTAETFSFQVRDRTIEHEMYTESLSRLKIPRVVLPRFEDWGEILRWILTENVPGEFPYAAGVFPLKRQGEDPTRMFAGEGGPERTNKRFHYVSLDQPAKRLSTAFDSVTLYGEEPATVVPTSTARSATRGFLSPPSTTPRSSIRGSTSATRRPPCR